MRTREGFTHGLAGADHRFFHAPRAAWGRWRSARSAILTWGWIGAIVGAVPGYLLGVWFAQRFSGVPLSPYAKGWVSLAMFIGGLAVLAIATR